mgnify:CR=1 FL=1
MKGISPLIATVLLIAFTVAVAAVISLWLTGFASTSSETVSQHAETELYCAYGGISISNLKYCSSTGRLAGIIENTRLVDIGNVTLQIIYANATNEKIYLAEDGSARSGGSTLSLTPREQVSFNVTIGGSNYDRIHVYTNCTNVYADARSNDVISSCT